MRRNFSKEGAEGEGKASWREEEEAKEEQRVENMCKGEQC